MVSGLKEEGGPFEGQRHDLEVTFVISEGDPPNNRVISMMAIRTTAQCISKFDSFGRDDVQMLENLKYYKLIIFSKNVYSFVKSDGWYLQYGSKLICEHLG